MCALTVKLNSQNWHIFWKIIGKASGWNRWFALWLHVALTIILISWKTYVPRHTMNIVVSRNPRNTRYVQGLIDRIGNSNRHSRAHSVSRCTILNSISVRHRCDSFKPPRRGLVDVRRGFSSRSARSVSQGVHEPIRKRVNDTMPTIWNALPMECWNMRYLRQGGPRAAALASVARSNRVPRGTIK